MDAPNPHAPSPTPSSPNAPAPFLAFTPAERVKAPDSPPPRAPPLLIFAVRCPCCGLRASRSSADESMACSAPCRVCSGPCGGFPQRAPSGAAPPLARRPVEDVNWQMRN